MKKKWLALGLASVLLFSAAAFAGCSIGAFEDNPANDKPGQVKPDPETPTTPGTPGTPETDNHYTVTLYYKNNVFVPAEPVEAIWLNDAEQHIATVENGRADAGELDGDFDVHLSGLDTKYSYNPNAYKATGDKRHIDIIIVDIVKPVRGDGGVNASPRDMALYQAGGCYVVNHQGTYRAVCRKNQYLYYEYAPTSAGWYSVSSWVDIYEDIVNPLMEVYWGNIGWKSFRERRDTGGASRPGGYTKNFLLNVYVTQAEVGNCFTFGIAAESKMGTYPVNVDFEIKYEGPHNPPGIQQETITAEEATTAAANSSATYHYADLNTKIFSGKNYAYSNKTKFYHFYDAELYASDPFGYGKGYGPIVCCELKKSIPCYTVTTLYNANSVGDSSIGYMENKLIVYVWSEELDGYIRRNYTNFVRNSYAPLCNADGVCYVTEELRQFLQDFAMGQDLWTDGIGAPFGSPEEKGYFAGQDDLWLFACGFYDEGNYYADSLA